MKTQQKIVTLGSLKKKIPGWQKEDKKTALTNGCFDVLHYGHVAYLQKAKKANRILIVGLNSDKSVRRIKGPQRPINTQEKRAGVLAALACVDQVVIFEEDDPRHLIQALKPDIYIKGADWKRKGVIGSEFIKQYGGKIEFIDFEKGLSSSRMIDRIIKSHG